MYTVVMVIKELRKSSTLYWIMRA